jgi:hypothetical protein
MSINVFRRDRSADPTGFHGSCHPENHDKDLNERLATAFDASQQFTNIIATTPVGLTSCPLWPSDKALYQATQRGNVSEALTQVMSQHSKGSLSPKEDTFKELRQSLLGFALS